MFCYEHINEQNGVNGNMEKEIQKEDKKKKSIIHIILYSICGMIIVLAVVAVVLYILLEQHGRKSAETIADDFMSGLNGKSGIKLYRLVSDDYIEYMCDAYGYSKLDLMKDLETSLHYFYEEAENESGYNLGCVKTVAVRSRSIKNADADKLSEMKEYFNKEFFMAIDDYAEVFLSCDVVGEKESIKMSVELYLYKIDEKWYFLDWYFEDEA